MSTSPLQNRVLPTGEIIAHPARGLLMGNRGCIHGPDRTLGVTRWRSKMWISCVLDWRGRRRDVMPPGRWTALFFLDEATALAAGHRPCGYCRRADHRCFADRWQAAQGLVTRPLASQLDTWLHAERVDRRTRSQVRRPAAFGDLPDGAMVRYDAGPAPERPAPWWPAPWWPAQSGPAPWWPAQSGPALCSGGALLPWSFAGYGAPVPVGPRTRVELLTPPSIVAVLAAGYRPLVHPSAGPTPMRSFPGAELP